MVKCNEEGGGRSSFFLGPNIHLKVHEQIILSNSSRL